jgi:hypothetical protein
MIKKSLLPTATGSHRAIVAACRLSLLLLPMMQSGCCTYLTVDSATHAYRHDSVRRIERAAITPDDNLVVLVDGAVAESSRVKRYTVTVPLPLGEDGVWVPQKGMSEGWKKEVFNRPDALPIAVGPPVVLPAYQSARGNPSRFSEIAGAERTLYLVRHSRPDAQTCLFYVARGQHPRKINIGLDGRDVKTPRRYPLLLLVPLTIPVDAATLPLQACFLLTLGDHGPPKNTPQPSPETIP